MGLEVGATVGFGGVIRVGIVVGFEVGSAVGLGDGFVVGAAVGFGDGIGVGSGVGIFVGSGVLLHRSGLHDGPQGPSGNSFDTRRHAFSILPPLRDSTYEILPPQV